MLGVFKEKYWRNAYYKNQQLNNVVNNVIMKYLLRDNALENSRFDKDDYHSLIYVDEETKQVLNDIFMMMSDLDFDVCFKSSQLVDEDLLNYYTSSQRAQFLAQNHCQNFNFL